MYVIPIVLSITIVPQLSLIRYCLFNDNHRVFVPSSLPIPEAEPTKVEDHISKDNDSGTSIIHPQDEVKIVSIHVDMPSTY